MEYTDTQKLKALTSRLVISNIDYFEKDAILEMPSVVVQATTFDDAINYITCQDQVDAGQVTLSPAQQLAHMIDVATERHRGQFDKSGRPYILHPLKVMHYLKSKDDLLNCVAVGHDLVEDTFGTTISQHQAGLAFLRAQGFDERVVAGISAISKLDGETYDQYLIRLSENDDSLLTKLSDLRHNTDIRRLKGLRQKDVDRNLKYYKAYMELSLIAAERGLL